MRGLQTRPQDTVLPHLPNPTTGTDCYFVAGTRASQEGAGILAFNKGTEHSEAAGCGGFMIWVGLIFRGVTIMFFAQDPETSGP